MKQNRNHEIYMFKPSPSLALPCLASTVIDTFLKKNFRSGVLTLSYPWSLPVLICPPYMSLKSDKEKKSICGGHVASTWALYNPLFLMPGLTSADP